MAEMDLTEDGNLLWRTVKCVHKLIEANYNFSAWKGAAAHDKGCMGFNIADIRKMQQTIRDVFKILEGCRRERHNWLDQEIGLW